MNCHNCRTNDDFDIKITLVAKRKNTNKPTAKK